MTEGGKIYQTGYLPGVFDLFHIGHLNLIRRAKERCGYLIVGVLTDELVKHFKGRFPVIPYEQRAEIVGAIREVDRVVPVDFGNTKKIDAWNRYHFDCHFSGDDHSGGWEEDKRQLAEVGAVMEFFPYTQGTSTTWIKARIRAEQPEKIYLFGAGKRCGHFIRKIADRKENGERWKIAGILDNDFSKNMMELDGVCVYGVDFVRYLKEKETIPVIITAARKTEIREQLEQLGFRRIYDMEEAEAVLRRG